MNEDQTKRSNLLDTTDCLEAVGVFRGWKNFLFIIVILCLLLSQLSFWLVNTGYVKAEDCTKRETSAVGDEDTEQLKKAAEKATAEPNQPVEAAVQEPPQRTGSVFGITFKRLAWLIRFVNAVLILSAALYCLTILFGLEVSLIGRLGGINHITRAFFLSLVMVVLLLPWQTFFYHEIHKLSASWVVGAIYTPGELVRWYVVEATGRIFSITLYYLRFTGYWLLIVLLLVLSQLRSARWTRAILRRLEVI